VPLNRRRLRQKSGVFKKFEELLEILEAVCFLAGID
jgi:hypothetical protein